MARILIAEDDEDVCFALTMVFRRAGFTVFSAPDGAVALELAGTQLPDFVLTDLDMPELNGLELCRAIRADPRLRDTPVAVLSGSLQPGDPRAAEAAVCAALLKPFTNDELVADVQRLLDHGGHDHTTRPSRCPLGTATPAV